jgi:thioredoxin-related protein
MRVLFLLILLCAGSIVQAAEGTSADLGAALVNPGFHDKPAWFKESFLDIRDDVEDAAGEGRRVILYFYQDGCPYCAKLLRDNLGDRGIAEKTRAGFDVIAVNMWGDREVSGLDGSTISEKAFARGLRVQFTPTLVFLDDAGEIVLRLNGYLPPHRFSAALDYAGGRHESIPFGDFVADAMPVPASGQLHTEPGFLSGPADLSGTRERPLLVMFEQRQCPACDELHLDVLKRAPVRASLEGFDVVLLDLRSKDEVTTPAGNRLPVRDWARRLGIQYAPTLVFFDQAGREVFRTEAYLRAFHVHGALDYVLSGAYREQAEFQRYLQDRRADFERRGINADLWQ